MRSICSLRGRHYAHENDFDEIADELDAEPRPDDVPLQFMATAEAYSRMYRAAENDPDSPGAQLAGTPIGQIAGMMNSVRPVRDVIFDMVEEYGEAVERMKALGM